MLDNNEFISFSVLFKKLSIISFLLYSILILSSCDIEKILSTGPKKNISVEVSADRSPQISWDKEPVFRVLVVDESTDKLVWGIKDTLIRNNSELFISHPLRYGIIPDNAFEIRDSNIFAGGIDLINYGKPLRSGNRYGVQVMIWPPVEYGYTSFIVE